MAHYGGDGGQQHGQMHHLQQQQLSSPAYVHQQRGGGGMMQEHSLAAVVRTAQQQSSVGAAPTISQSGTAGNYSSAVASPGHAYSSYVPQQQQQQQQQSTPYQYQQYYQQQRQQQQVYSSNYHSGGQAPATPVHQQQQQQQQQQYHHQQQPKAWPQAAQNSYHAPPQQQQQQQHYNGTQSQQQHNYHQQQHNYHQPQQQQQQQPQHNYQQPQQQPQQHSYQQQQPQSQQPQQHSYQQPQQQPQQHNYQQQQPQSQQQQQQPQQQQPQQHNYQQQPQQQQQQPQQHNYPQQPPPRQPAQGHPHYAAPAQTTSAATTTTATMATHTVAAAAAGGGGFRYTKMEPAFKSPQRPLNNRPQPAPNSAPSGHNRNQNSNASAWPEDMQDWVARAFGQCASNKDREDTTQALKAVIEEATTKNVLWARNWRQFPLPDLSGGHAAQDPRLRSPKRQREAGNTRDRTHQPHHQQQQNSSYYGPSSSAGGGSGAGSSNDRNHSYYGPSGGGGGGVEKRRGKKRKTWGGAGEDFTDPREIHQRAKRAHRFERSAQQMGTSPPRAELTMAAEGDSELDWDKLTVVGTCQKLEKEYFRLNTIPNPATIRPEPVLQKALTRLKLWWNQQEAPDYVYMCSQLKGIRQDLTVQRIKNSFTVDVYETHARIALEVADVNEYNQSQTQLQELYASGLAGAQMEFLAYRIMYSLVLQTNKKYQGGSSDLYEILWSLDGDARADPSVAHALAVREATGGNNYHSFFKLWATAPNMGAYLLDHLVESVRFNALRSIVKAYKPSVPVSFICAELGFEDEAEGRKWLTDSGGQFTASAEAGDCGELDTKTTRVQKHTGETKNSLI